MSRYEVKISYVLYSKTAFINYLDQFLNVTEYHELLIIKSTTIFEQISPISLNISKFDSTLLTVSRDLKKFIHQCTNDKEIFDMQERHNSMELSTNKNFFSENYSVDIFLFITAIFPYWLQF